MGFDTRRVLLDSLERLRRSRQQLRITIGRALRPGEPITVTLQTHGPVERYLRPGRYELAAGSRVERLLKKAGTVPAGQPVSLLIRGNRVEPTHRLQEGDVVVAMQFVAGG
jgi:sulfur carrier protein ThiS